MGQLASQNTTCVPVKKTEVIIPVQAQKLSITCSVKIMHPAEDDAQTVTIYHLCEKHTITTDTTKSIVTDDTDMDIDRQTRQTLTLQPHGGLEEKNQIILQNSK